ncbi:phosphonate C-P lyase system protein PhnG [Photobacterium sanctipauli]|uniref:Phosphonate C-P lyase system protein PhnG n=1 Tax=Photobacterium sanctipauli TaxID=1342794 RepID=A0A2T3NN16_9GAMM|nr:phosphonate C-P lyase system protein PhnG [Photobacterium sanctipauli]PSW16858.1 phosphonate C-P lyase system protein PhnG [Photobacterium sanctipauli]
MDTTDQRKNWMSVVAKANFDQLKQHWETLTLNPEYQVIRPAEIGLAQVRARMGGTGRQFNVGDVTITRAVIQLASGEMGYSYLQGRNKQHAELAAVIDAMLQTEQHHRDVMELVITPLAANKQEQETLKQQQVASSKVDFFTMVRGED